MPTDYTCLTRSGFDLDIAVLLAEASAAAYLGEAEILVFGQKYGLAVRAFFDRSNVQGFWCTAGEVALLAFRGTSNTEQWLRDARFLAVPYPWGWVHRGFKDGVEDVELDLQAFDEAARQAQHVWFTGHSLGGALAVLAAARLKRKGISSSTYTYGQPRVGLGAFAERFSIELPGRLHRFVNQSDIVTRVPPGLLYRHTGIVKRIVRPGVLESALQALGTHRTSELEISLAETTATHTLESTLVSPRATNLSSSTIPQGLESTILESAQAIAGAGLQESMFIGCDLPPMSDEEFTRLQMSLQARTGLAGPDGLQLEGSLPWFADHAIANYIRLLSDIRDRA